MVVLYGTNERLVAALEDAFRARFAVTRAGSWQEVHRCLPAAVCAVIVIENLADSLERQHLAKLAARASEQLVLVTARDAEGMRQLRNVVVNEVFWTCEPVHKVTEAAERLWEQRGVKAVHRELKGAAHLPPQLRSALCRACASPEPVQSVAGLAGLLGCDRGTLARQWRAAVGPGTRVRLQDFLDWLLLLRAVEMRALGRKWSAVAADLEVHPHTLARGAERLCRASLATVAAAGAQALHAEFRRAVLQVLIETPPATTCETAAQTAASGGTAAA